ncbi:MAG: 50S ribosomal protein L4 [Mobiluncus porci]|uniref:Large ribosomal subunit protein uL4 n=1 Tax=Mobiluncus porci TaxID=2652278 RepID=A0A7K0K2C0_9ACTO|nr:MULTISPECIES: 50S ribosomal protein L4 [Mobiluncus]MCI6583925.1 50S ribosomal protein L4 [Mobiluncus sp.]MDD7542388.1 50S ribosomal protein L4 [Mobiluncus porci]MDY5747697.1 50S ribosomal protein L4 [Mobiluncus porci]MST49623.1 50S ribosomal protein L4 [Mobiluncus porci]
MTETRNIDILDASGKKTGTAELPGDVFDLDLNIPLVHQVVNAQLAAARQGTHATKTRADVSGGGKKPFRQKGTGRARQGSIRAPQFAGGGIVHGPQPRDYSQKTPKKMKAAALRQALSDRARAGRIHVLSDFGVTETPSTKAAKAALTGVVDNRRALIVLTPEVDDVVALSVNNLAEHHALFVGELNTYDVLANDDVVFSSTALDSFLKKGEDK